ncbi:MAG TPA: hypothetical protein VGV88_14250 [Candidatus Dormibacteraeota bacterium]|nr:hypothetical protein [Candidatus Dormibacteraeota bacterium]
MRLERALIDLFHEALDAEDVAGPFQRLQLELEKPSGAMYRRSARRILMTRNRLVLLAAALVLIVGVSVLVGTHAYSGLHVGQSAPAGGSGKTALDQLLARPIQFKSIPAGQTCPASGPNTDGLLGGGPVYIGAGLTADTSTNWGHYGSSTLLTPPGMVGPVLLRATDLSTGLPLAQVGPYAAGSVSGNDTVNGAAVQRHGYAVLDTSHPPTTTYDFLNSPYVQWPGEYGWAHTTTGFCVGIQIDGPSFTELIRDQVNPS